MTSTSASEPAVSVTAVGRSQEAAPSNNGARIEFGALRAVDGDHELRVAVYLHPGRTRVATIAAGQAAEQFDLIRAREYPSLGAAELACDDRRGFLLEIAEPFLDGEGQRRDGTILFVPGLGH